MSTQVNTKKFAWMPSNGGFSGGLSSENPIVMAKNQLFAADNILVGTTTSRRKRGGREKYHTGSFDQTASYPVSGVPIRGIIEFWRTASLAGNPTSDIFLHQGTKVWSIDDRNTPGVDRTGSFTFDLDAVPCYQPFNQLLYFTSTKTSDGYNRWDGNALTSAQSATSPLDGPGKYIISHTGRMVMAGNDDFPFRVYFSSFFDADDWNTSAPSTGTSLDVDADGDPEGITGLASFQNRLYVFTRRSIYEVTGSSPEDFVVLKVSSGIGCLSHASICPIPNDVIFASDRGVHSLKQIESGRISESKFLSRDIQRLWVDLLNPALYKRIMGVYDETINNYILSVPSSGQVENDNLLCYNIEFGTWTVWPNINARSINTILLSNKKALITGGENGVIGLLNRTNRTDFDEPFNARFKTAVLYPGEETSEKIFKSVTIYIASTNVSQVAVSWEIDGSKTGSRAVELGADAGILGTTFVLGSSRLGIGQFVPVTIPIDEVGYGIQIEITLGGDADVECYGFILETDDSNPNYGTM